MAMDEAEIAAILTKPKPDAGQAISHERIEHNRWHYASILDGVNKMKAGYWTSPSTAKEREDYIKSGEQALSIIDQEIAAIERALTTNS